jgi:hypothetical protein
MVLGSSGHALRAAASVIFHTVIAANLYFSDFIRWAHQNPDFLRWLSSLRFFWIETLMEYETQHRNVDHSNVGMLGPPAYQPVSTVGTGYGHTYRVTKLIDVNIRENTPKNFSLKYFNRQGTPLQLSLHTDRSDLLAFGEAAFTIPSSGFQKLQLKFSPLSTGSIFVVIL